MRIIQKLKCKMNMHTAGYMQPAVGGRNVRRCTHCDVVVEEESVMKNYTWKGKLNFPRIRLPKGKITDSWFKK